ncbi:MAG: hypothetical protein A2845_03575 [Candidatus Lloydbacteria bacterium RIFCSPHIGHO2_01_FULL_49_22]|uniref:Uncharacterized protein n=1 Tax=Candidatus Lloydbacteria bacterium RIFCSPHIGHO2_01_FULL_49_22 TaxID=1798658 RepID=A0A1G2CWW0_9BACT|nr:MAG: hypothetical protein A2845_03575 [Candidatus Lloydbacteria bacterium RIFCSPHIGHO2_01_FULL_49_22]OGZ09009.1 MAG: hypothetical protein A3C14_03410 [Candidatus Lloydbacteria bacterium RIFCSPHIGHO2_02_FULL_50_18]
MTSSLFVPLALFAVGIWALISVITAFSIPKIRKSAWHSKLIHAVDDFAIWGDCGRCRYAALLFLAPCAIVILRPLFAIITVMTENDALAHFHETISQKWSKICPPLSVERPEHEHTETTWPRQ